MSLDMTWAFAVFGIFSVFFSLVFAFLVFVYKREYDREERIVEEMEKARLAASKMSLVYLPIESIEASGEKPMRQKEEVAAKEPPMTEREKKGLN
jgi:hypothetical protein